ncbi:MAG TPA: DUF2975 domain-containing protein [Ignavibacteriaceae bacterium]|nr:DUF2975 domain-containing protein [Ignavibacteriaceae bacterium]
MNSFHSNRLVKYTYAIVNLFKIIFPFYIVSVILMLLFGSLNNGNLTVFSFDYFKVFDSNTLIKHSSNTFHISFIILLDVLIIGGIYLTLIKLNLFLKNVFNEEPFNIENGKALKTIGIIASLLTIIYYSSIYLFHSVDKLPLSTFWIIVLKIMYLLTIVFNPYLIISLFIYVLGEIIVHAAKLKQENDLTV